MTAYMDKYNCGRVLGNGGDGEELQSGSNRHA